MKKLLSAISLFFFCQPRHVISTFKDEIVLDREIMKLSYESAVLSHEAYSSIKKEEDAYELKEDVNDFSKNQYAKISSKVYLDWDDDDDDDNESLMKHARTNNNEKESIILKQGLMNENNENNHNIKNNNNDDPFSDYTMYTVYNDEPDQAIVAQKDGICYGVFRGTDPKFADWMQNFDTRNVNACSSNDNNSCCTAKHGFYDGYHTRYKDLLESDLRACSQNCTKSSEYDTCVVLAGHSQGGAIANIAAIYFADLNPLVITFGQPPAIFNPCTIIDSSRVYRWINSMVILGVRTFDPIPFWATGNKADFPGHLLVLEGGEDSVAYLGLDFWIFDSLHVDPSTWAHTRTSYIESLGNLFLGRTKEEDYPVPSNGFVNGVSCAMSNNLCASDRCDGECKPKADTCGSCNEDSDCETGHCVAGNCADYLGDGVDGCNCLKGSDCGSNRCEYKSWINPYRECTPKLPNESYCNEDNDCISGHCSWGFKCKGSKK